MSRPTLRVYLQRGVWRADFSLPLPGRKRRRRFRLRVLGAKSEREALKLGAVLRHELSRKLLAEATGKRGDITFTKYLDDCYLPTHKRKLRAGTWRAYEQMLRVHILPAFGHRRLRGITTEEIERYISDLASGAKGRPLSPGTRNKHLSLIRVVLRHAHERSYLERDPTKVIKAEPTPFDRDRFNTFTLDEARRFLQVTKRLRPRWYAFFYTWIRSGCRLGELAAFTWSDVDLTDGLLHVNRAFSAGVEGPTKSRRKRVIPLDDQFVGVLREHLRTAAGHRVFLSNGGEILDHNKVKATYRTLIKHSGVTPMRFHDGRHTFASHLAQHDVGETKIAELLGHSDPRTTKRYLHPRREHLREAIARLPSLVEPLADQREE